MPAVPSWEELPVTAELITPAQLDALSNGDFSQHLVQRGIELRIKGDKLSLNAPAGALTPALQAELRRRKIELVDLLKHRALEDRQNAAPLSFAQERLWLFDQFSPGSAAYNIPQSWVLEGPLEILLLNRAVQLLLERHTGLRTRFEVRNGIPLQVLHSELANQVDAQFEEPVSVTDLSQELDNLARQAQLEAALVTEGRMPFSLATGPLIRFHLFKLSPEHHVFSYNIHHIVADQRSLIVLRRDLTYLYTSLLSGKVPALPKLLKDYRTFASESRSDLALRLHSQQLAYWRERLSTMPTRLELPFSKTRPPEQTYAGSRYRQQLDASLTAKIRKLAKLTNTSLYSLMLTIFSVLLYRYTGQKDICIGTPISTRKRLEEEDIVGLFINMLPLRSTIEPASSFALLLQQLREKTLRDIENGDIPFQRLVAELQEQNSQSFSPFFQIMFALNPKSPDGDQPENEVDIGVAKVDLTLQIAEQQDTLHACFEYRTDLFSFEDIRQFSDHFRALIESVVSDPKTPVESLNLITAAEQAVLNTWNDTDLVYERSETLISLFEQQAAQSPESLAIATSNGNWSFQELAAHSEAVAQTLLSHGVSPGQIVAICAERTPELIAGLLGIMRAGCAYLPLDPKYPDERLLYMLHDSGAHLVLTSSDTIGNRLSNGAEPLQPLQPIQPVKFVALKEACQPRAVAPPPKPAHPAAPHDAAYVIYTSGSTGQPKGTVIEHRNTVALLRWAMAFFPADSLRRILASTSVCFDLSIFEIFLPLVTGNTIVLVDDVLQLNASAHAQSVTLINTVPSAMNTLLQSGLPASVNTVCLAGEFLSTDLVNRVYQAGAARVFDLYGPTETTTYSTVALRDPGTDANIGSPIANTRIHLLDDNKLPVPLGAIGEIYIAGDGVTPGYLNRTALTAERFISLPAIDACSRLYRTGDLAHQLQDGTLVYRGRLDGQVKLRGHRIELGEIESALREVCRLEDLVVLLQASPGGDELVAFIGNSTSHAKQRTSWIESLHKRLPAYMVPTLILMDQPLPRTLNGKIDRKALAPYRHPASPKAFEPPVDLLEQWLSNIFAASFHQANIARDAHFFDDLGGQSLIAFEVFVQIEQRLGVPMPLTRLFQSPTIEAMANDLRSQTWKQLESITMRRPGAGSSAVYLMAGSLPSQIYDQSTGSRVMVIQTAIPGNLRHVAEEIRQFEASKSPIDLYCSQQNLPEAGLLIQELRRLGFNQVRHLVV